MNAPSIGLDASTKQDVVFHHLPEIPSLAFELGPVLWPSSSDVAIL